MPDKRYLDISKSYEECIEKIEDFDQSIFRDLYENLYGVIAEIIEEGVKERGNKKYEDKKRGDIITVLGKRGSGKSSVLLSFTNSLAIENRTKWKQIPENVQFCVMENLDASMLDAKEDVFDILLSRMLKNVDKCIEENRYDARMSRKDNYEILQLFDEIYQKHQSIIHTDLEPGYSALSALRNAPDSLGLTDKFEELVQKYLDMMLGDSWDRERYLIIPIDDLDMNGDKGMESLEQIYRYVSVKNVIVIIAVKYEQIVYLAEKNGYKIFPKLDRELEDEKVQYVNNYAKEYLAKLLPISKRVYMPDILCNQQEIEDKWFIKDGKTEYMIKESILYAIVKKTGMYFDICGKRMHFLMPETLRELKGYYRYLNSQPEENKEQNLEHFINDFLNRITNKKLSYKQRKDILFLCELDYTGINNWLTTYFLKRDESVRRGYLFREGYGELLRYLYYLSRETQEEKQFVNAVIIFYTYLAQRCMLKDRDVEKYTGRKETMQNLFINSWIGSWSNNLVPRFYGVELNREDEESNPFLKLASKKSWARLWGCLQTIDNGIAQIGREWKCCRVKSSDDWIENHQDKIEELEWIFFFFEEFYSERNERQEICLSMEEKEDGRLEWRVTNQKCDFNIFAFVKNSYYFEEYFDKLYNAMAEGMVEALQENLKSEQKNKIQVRMIKDKLKKRSKLYAAYKRWAEFSNGIAMPFQHTDIYYHVLCRIQNQNRSSIIKSIDNDSLLDNLRDLFEKVGNILEEEVKGYSKIESINFAKNFRECPFIEIFLNKEMFEEWNEKEKDAFGQMIRRCAAASESSRKSERVEADLTTRDDLGFETYDW